MQSIERTEQRMERYEYYINGWRETERYVLGLCRLTKSEIERMKAGETIVKDGDKFEARKRK